MLDWLKTNLFQQAKSFILKTPVYMVESRQLVYFGTNAFWDCIMSSTITSKQSNGEL